METFKIRAFKINDQVAFAPVRLWPRMLLDSEVSQDKDGVRRGVEVFKKIGHLLGLRREDNEMVPHGKTSIMEEEGRTLSILSRSLSSEL